MPPPGDESADTVWAVPSNYLALWRRANETAKTLNSAMQKAGWDSRIRATAHITAAGDGVVVLKPEMAEWLAKLVM